MAAQKNAIKIPILTYHRVISDRQRLKYKARNGLLMPVSKFKRQMSYLSKNGFQTISCNEFYDWYIGKIELPEKTVMLTFDDGFYEMYYRALPILKKYNLKAVSFCVGKQTKETTSPLLKGMSKKYLGQDLIDRTSQDYPNLEFQSHTYDLHRKKDDIPYAEIKSLEEIQDDFHKMERFRYDYIAYPYGSYSENMATAVKESGIKMGFGYKMNKYATRDDDIFNISRIAIYSNISQGEFIDCVNGIRVPK